MTFSLHQQVSPGIVTRGLPSHINPCCLIIVQWQHLIKLAYCFAYIVFLKLLAWADYFSYNCNVLSIPWVCSCCSFVLAGSAAPLDWLGMSLFYSFGLAGSVLPESASAAPLDWAGSEAAAPLDWLSMWLLLLQIGCLFDASPLQVLFF